MKPFFLLCMLALLATLSVAAGAQELQVAPLNPQFTAWQANKAATGEGLGYIPSPIDWSRSAAPASKATPPSSYDLRTANKLTAVKNQGSCGACWAFSTCSAMEGWAKFAQGLTLDLSENNIKNHHGFLIDSCLGGNDDMAIAYLARGDGPLAESDDPYNPGAVTNPVPGATRVIYVKSMRVFNLGSAGERAEIQNAVMTYGALSVSMTWNNTAFNSSTNTYFLRISGNGGGHAVALVGWDDNKYVPGAPLDGRGAWICKNSWGTGWGESGYFYLSYYDADAVKDARGYTDSVPASTYSRIYQHDPLGMDSSSGFGSPSIWGANVFTAAAAGRITGVGTWAVGHNTAYQVTVYKSGYNGGFSNPVATASGTAAQPGYFVIDLPTAVELTAGQKFSVVIHYNTPGEGYPLPIEAPYDGYASPTASPGQSYLSDTGSSWSDITSQGGSWASTNICIKALVSEAPPAVELNIYGPGMVQVGSALNFRVFAKNLVGAATYQWQKDHLNIDGATAATFDIPFANTYNSGAYTVVVTDESKTTYESRPVYVNVLAEGSLPVAGMAGMAALAAALSALSLRRRRQ